MSECGLEVFLGLLPAPVEMIVICSRHQLQIFLTVIVTVAVDMVYMLIFTERSSNFLFHYNAMFIFPTAFCFYNIVLSIFLNISKWRFRWMPLNYNVGITMDEPSLVMHQAHVTCPCISFASTDHALAASTTGLIDSRIGAAVTALSIVMHRAKPITEIRLSAILDSAYFHGRSILSKVVKKTYQLSQTLSSEKFEKEVPTLSVQFWWAQKGGNVT